MWLTVFFFLLENVIPEELNSISAFIASKFSNLCRLESILKSFVEKLTIVLK